MLWRLQNSAALPGRRVVPAANRISSLLPWTLATRFCPQVPIPTMAARIIVSFDDTYGYDR
jgi:hypothetical protein